MIRRPALLAPAMAFLAACQSAPTPETSGTADTHASMVGGVNPASLAIWDVTNNALGETGGLDPTLMDSAAWTKLENAARALENHSLRLAHAQTLRVGAHNDNVEGFATRAEIQAMIDADPDGFRALSREMAEHARQLAQAAAARNVREAGALAETLSDKCSSCHTRYWEKPA